MNNRNESTPMPSAKTPPPPSQGAEGRTPRTEAVAFNMYDAVAAEDSCQMVVERDFARQLETELASARAELAEAKKTIASRNKLIEQLNEESLKLRAQVEE